MPLQLYFVAVRDDAGRDIWRLQNVGSESATVVEENVKMLRAAGAQATVVRLDVVSV